MTKKTSTYRRRRSKSIAKRRRRSSGKTKRTRRRKSKTSNKYAPKRKLPKGITCKQLVQKQIRFNMKEWKRGKYRSQGQAIAVAYRQVQKQYPSCKSVFTKMRRESVKRRQMT